MGPSVTGGFPKSCNTEQTWILSSWHVPVVEKTKIAIKTEIIQVSYELEKNPDNQIVRNQK